MKWEEQMKRGTENRRVMQNICTNQQSIRREVIGIWEFTKRLL